MADERGNDKPEPELPDDAYEREMTTDLEDSTPDRPKGMPLHTRILIGLVVGVVAGVAVNKALGGGDERIGWVIANITDPVGQLFLRLLLIALQMGFGSQDWRLFRDLPHGLWRAITAGGIGLFSALMGIGGGAFGVTVLTLSGRPIHQAVATASGFGAAIALPATSVP